MVFLLALYSWHAPPSTICWVKEYLSVVEVFGASKSSDKQYTKETLFGFLECFLLGVWVNMLPSDWKGEPLCVPQRPGPKPALNTICGGAKIKNVGTRQFWIGEKDSIVKYFPSRSNLAEIAGRRLHRLRITLHWLRRCIEIVAASHWHWLLCAMKRGCGALHWCSEKNSNTGHNLCKSSESKNDVVSYCQDRKNWLLGHFVQWINIGEKIKHLDREDETPLRKTLLPYILITRKIELISANLVKCEHNFKPKIETSVKQSFAKHGLIKIRGEWQGFFWQVGCHRILNPGCKPDQKITLRGGECTPPWQMGKTLGLRRGRYWPSPACWEGRNSGGATKTSMNPDTSRGSYWIRQRRSWDEQRRHNRAAPWVRRSDTAWPETTSRGAKWAK